MDQQAKIKEVVEPIVLITPSHESVINFAASASSERLCGRGFVHDLGTSIIVESQVPTTSRIHQDEASEVKFFSSFPPPR